MYENKKPSKAQKIAEQKPNAQSEFQNCNPNQNHNVKKESLGPNTKR